ncbi:hypothetical protein XELAEV_18031535mg [Xenopus laevis]|uniref:Uncharacterized protein n=1 Tax=Xenopus laevis TaxID=8355 RepID=A0A974HG53_XENLA|nr:hypothetical protein XELAEV_18031535mg [Xenopus laevis]
MLETVVRLHSPPGIRNWVDIETYFASDGNLMQLFWLPKRSRPANANLLPTRRISLHIWDTMVNKLKLTTFPSPLTPIAALKYLIPNINLQIWNAKGITTIEHLYFANSLRRFEDLPTSQYYTYLQITHFLTYRCKNHTP